MIELSSCDPINHDDPQEPLASFPRISEPLSYDEFFREFLEKNRPCVFSSSFTQEWLAREDWVTPSNTPNVEFLRNHFGDGEVPVADCDQKHYDSQEKKTYKLRDYIDYWHSLRDPCLGKKSCLYLKDWHFVRDFPAYKAYSTLQYFASDWLNEFWHVRSDIHDDYQFVYMGPKGSWTPFHADVFRSYSWSANVCGRKRWVFYPPGEDQFLRDPFGTPVYDVDSPDLKDIRKYPNAASAKGRIEVIQEQGETIFVPSCWHHQVWNLEDTISINHNWLNGTNLHRAWYFLVESLQQVEYAIRDCSDMDDWTGQCQLLLHATHGMDYHEFYTFLQTIARRRIETLTGKKTHLSFGIWENGKNHILYDLKKIQWCLEQLLDDERLDTIKGFSDTENHPSNLLDQVVNVLS
ncbi:2-oxoglutarate and iron-dependent oxygenase JMJD4-like [Penaeus monodon]|uniref:2-oxoglutarate and iron-dependent oxygenase JMJD4-like n=1 Tax=Penaeus monodon TaxID=6687 RepID=UPI0018A7AA2F|nr:2-oxoglutarate and iron-dependent oxygenase JMJD4-like [Penaeus monodon]